MASTFGIFQSDVIIKSAIQAAMDDLRANPWLLDYVFISLPQDALTASDYGEAEIDKAKEWFLSTDIPIFITPRIDEAKMPCISIALAESAESQEVTLGDVNYETEIDLPDNINLAGPFEAIGFKASTGTITINDSDLNGLILGVGMNIVDSKGNVHPILDVLDTTAQGITHIVIAPNVLVDISSIVIRGTSPMFRLPLESTVMRESYNIGCHVNSDFVHMLYLHSILTFALLRYKQRLLEARGFERSSISSADPQIDPEFGNELVFERFITLAGYVRQYWPKDLAPTIQSVSFPIAIEGAGHLPNDTNPDIASWIGDADSIGLISRE